MASTLLKDIVLFLIEAGQVTGDGIDAFRDFTPEAPDSLVVLHEYSGDAVNPLDVVVHRSVQITTRDKDPDAARAKALAIHNLLNVETRIVNFTTTRWGQVYIRQTPFRLVQDKNERTVYCFNIGITTTNE